MNIENLTKLRDFLRDEVPDARFNMRSVVSRKSGRWIMATHVRQTLTRHSGTAGCIVGWAHMLWKEPEEALGLEWQEESALFMPCGFSEPGSRTRYPRTRAVETLTRLIETGEVDWGPEP